MIRIQFTHPTLGDSATDLRGYMEAIRATAHIRGLDLGTVWFKAEHKTGKVFTESRTAFGAIHRDLIGQGFTAKDCLASEKFRLGLISIHAALMRSTPDTAWALETMWGCVAANAPWLVLHEDATSLPSIAEQIQTIGWMCYILDIPIGAFQIPTEAQLPF